MKSAIPARGGTDNAEQTGGFNATITFMLFPREGQPPKSDGFSIAKATHEETGREISLKGAFGPASAGQMIHIISCRWQDDPRYGRFCNVFKIDRAEPVTEVGLVDYFAAMPEISRNTADAIVAALGEDVLSKIDDNPSILNTIKTGPNGLQVDQIELAELAENWIGARNSKKAIAGLTALGIGDSTAAKIVDYFGTDWEAIKDDPYLITDVPEVGFPVADHLAKKQGIKPADPRRLESGVRYVLDQAELDGNICLSREEMLKRAPELLKRKDMNYVPSAEEISIAVEAMIEKGKLWSETSDVDGVERIYTAQQFFIETRLYEKVEELLHDHSIEGTVTPKLSDKAIVTEEQWGSVANCYNERLSILTGGPGTGKTTSLLALLDQLDRDGRSYACMAPTGKASKRMTESTGREASTIIGVSDSLVLSRRPTLKMQAWIPRRSFTKMS